MSDQPFDNWFTVAISSKIHMLKINIHVKIKVREWDPVYHSFQNNLRILKLHAWVNSKNANRNSWVKGHNITKPIERVH